MWYRIAKIESEIFNTDKSNDPKNLRGLLEGFIASIKLKTSDSQTIANAFRSYKNKLVNEDIYLPNEIENIYDEIAEIYELPQPENSQTKSNEKDSVIIENLSFSKPVSGPITSNFGAREAPMPGASTDHKGIDFDGETGDSVNASEAGTVSHAGPLGSFGNLVKIDHGSGLETYYAHLDSIIVNVGDVVTKGQMVGAMGASGRATGSHLHFELRQNGTPINPRFSSKKKDNESLVDDRNLLSTVVVLKKQDDKIYALIEKRGSSPKKHEWALPGGHVEKGETTQEGAVREVKEETGVDLDIESLMLIDQFINDKGKHHHFFCTKVKKSHPTHAGSDAEKAEWYDVDDLPELAWNHEQYIRRAIKKLFN